jgi:hypothetical protein
MHRDEITFRREFAELLSRYNASMMLNTVNGESYISIDLNSEYFGFGHEKNRPYIEMIFGTYQDKDS